MREDLLHFIWKYKKLQLDDLTTSQKEHIRIEDVGVHNHLSGPDFFNAKIRINGQLWAGNVEIHLKSSDWYGHGHEKDPNYDNVILHVVWEDDLVVIRKDHTEIPTLELRNYISKDLLTAYQNLFDGKQKTFINCERSLALVDTFILDNWLERLFFERLERKNGLVTELLLRYKNDWEHVLFALLLRNFGSKINGAAFLDLAHALDFSTVRKLCSNVLHMECVLFGMLHMLEDDAILDAYYFELKKEYAHLKKKFDLSGAGVRKPEFFKLRPSNFPTVRLSQFANLYATHQNFFREVIEASSLEKLYSLFAVSVSPYWTDHYVFGKSSKRTPKKLTRRFVDLLIVNTILPLKFCYARSRGREDGEAVLSIITAIKKEENNVIANFGRHGAMVENAMGSQALLQLYAEYCSKNKCLQCAVGSSLMKS